MRISEEQITAGAKWLALNVMRTEWSGLRPDGRARDGEVDPWHRGRYSHNARQEDYRDAVREMLAEMGLTQQLRISHDD